MQQQWGDCQGRGRVPATAGLGWNRIRIAMSAVASTAGSRPPQQGALPQLEGRVQLLDAPVVRGHLREERSHQLQGDPGDGQGPVLGHLRLWVAAAHPGGRRCCGQPGDIRSPGLSCNRASAAHTICCDDRADRPSPHDPPYDPSSPSRAARPIRRRDILSGMPGHPKAADPRYRDGACVVDRRDAPAMVARDVGWHRNGPHARPHGTRRAVADASGAKLDLKRYNLTSHSADLTLLFNSMHHLHGA